MRPRSMRFAAPLPLALLPSSAAACSLCHTPSAVAVRAAVFGPDLLPNLLAIAAPAPVLAAAVWLLRRAVA